jgi:hypothetical protein
MVRCRRGSCRVKPLTAGWFTSRSSHDSSASRIPWCPPRDASNRAWVVYRGPCGPSQCAQHGARKHAHRVVREVRAPVPRAAARLQGCCRQPSTDTGQSCGPTALPHSPRPRPHPPARPSQHHMEEDSGDLDTQRTRIAHLAGVGLVGCGGACWGKDPDSDGAPGVDIRFLQWQHAGDTRQVPVPHTLDELVLPAGRQWGAHST